MSAKVQNVRNDCNKNRTPWTIVFSDKPNMEKPKDRLRQARAAAGYETPSDAARAHPRDININTLISNENGNREISRKAAEKYGKLFGVTAGWILYGENAGTSVPQVEPGLRRVVVAGHVQAGEWMEAWEWDFADQYPIYVPDLPEYRSIKLYAAETRGPSMNRRYPEGTVVVFADVQQTGEDPIPGKRYVVERCRSSGECEHTVKLLAVDAEGKHWLVPESDDPRYQAPISVEEGVDDGDTVTIVGRVVFSVNRE